VDASFLAEQKSLKSFKRCVEGNKNIMLSYTSFGHGSDFTIISPLADLDLHTFFKGAYPDFPTRSRGFTPAQLLYGASRLAGALSFLHEGLQPVGIAGKIYCAHLDLKPENILVVWNNSEPAGRWLVHDFGTSKIKEKSSAQTLAPGDLLRQFSLTQPRRTPGPFQAPEVERAKEKVVGTESDIWSLGCILAVVLSFAFGGPSHVTKLFNSRIQEGNVEDNDYFYEKRDNKAVLKGEVVRWLDSMITGKSEDIWIKDTLSLIYSALVEKQTARPSAKVIKEKLDAIYLRKDIRSLKQKCRWAPVELHGLPLASPGAAEVVERARKIESQGEIPRMVVNRPTGLEIEPGLEVVPLSQLSSPRTNSTSQFSDKVSYTVDDSGTSANPVSRSSSTSTRPVSLTEDSTFMKYEVPKDTFKTVICYSACHVAFISKKRAMVVRLGDEGTWEKNHKPPIINDDSRIRSIHCPDNCEWDFASLSGQYLLLRSKRPGSRERRVRDSSPYIGYSNASGRSTNFITMKVREYGARSSYPILEVSHSKEHQTL
jgi:serine/threonine protein kinase